MPSASRTAPIVSGEPHQRGRQRVSCRVGVDAVGEVEVELEDVGAELEDVLETRVAGTGVVHRDAHAAGAEDVERGHERGVVVEAGVLGQLEHDALAGDGCQARFEGAARRGRGRRVDRKELLGPELGKLLERAIDGGQFELDTEPDVGGFGEPFVRWLLRVR